MQVFEQYPANVDWSLYRAADTYTDTPDPDNDRIIRVWDVVPLSQEELEQRTQQENAQLVQDVAQAVQTHMDTIVKSRNYDSILSACTYAVSSIPKYQQEGLACVEWRDSVWVKCFELLEEVQTGVRAKMTPTEVVAELPVLIWPTA